MEAGKKRIGQLLIEHGYISPRQLEEALRVQQKKNDKICSILMDLGHLSEANFLEFLSSMPGMASIDLSSCEMAPELLETVRHELAHRLELVPIGRIGNVLTVAMVCPLDEKGQEELEEATGLKVRPVLCSRSAVVTTLDRYYGDFAEGEEQPGEAHTLSGLGEALKLHSVARLVAEIQELPTLPDIVNRVSQAANDPNSSAADLAEIIETDGSISAKLLKLANSPAFGFSRKISQIQHAIALLGFKETKLLVLSVVVLDYFAGNEEFDFRAYWNHAFACASLARLICRKMKTSEMETAFVAGLLHDVGKVALALKVPGKQKKAAMLCSEKGMTSLQAEEAVLGLTHAETGYLLGEHWFLPSNLTDAIRYHHSIEEDATHTELSAVVFLANIFCKMSPSALREMKGVDEDIRGVLNMLGLTEDIFLETLREYAETASDVVSL